MIRPLNLLELDQEFILGQFCYFPMIFGFIIFLSDFVLIALLRSYFKLFSSREKHVSFNSAFSSSSIPK